MADARALLRAKRQEVRIDHPLASYNASGQLRCIACGTAVKHATAWEGHIGSKTHRTNAARLREERAREERRLAEERERESLKRKTMEDEDGDEDADADAEEEGTGEPAKRPRLGVESAEDSESAHGREAPRPAAAAANAARSALPPDFFSDPSQAPAPADEDDEDEEGAAPTADGTAAAAAAAATTPAGTAAAPDVLDLEWAQFQQTVVNAPDVREMYESATIVAEPVLAAEVPEGFPTDAVSGAPAEAAAEEVLDEEALRRRKEQEERELIMDRLLEEEQAQEEADARVTQLKSKLEALKKKREAAKAAKKGTKAS
ncbi:hypothetical protein C8Q77DRAFT_1155892 [Trametes polyzona]|nr:hypothetical protein C8Q77DRAFT_1155892 [Trametes polyzona]